MDLILIPVMTMMIMMMTTMVMTKIMKIIDVEDFDNVGEKEITCIVCLFVFKTYMCCF
jgi:hypothetical protein